MAHHIVDVGVASCCLPREHQFSLCAILGNSIPRQMNASCHSSRGARRGNDRATKATIFNRVHCRLHATLRGHTASSCSESAVTAAKPTVTATVVTTSSKGNDLPISLEGFRSYQPLSESDLRVLESLSLDDITTAASRVRDQRPDDRFITFSPKVFIPVTRLCRDTCGYCTFAEAPEEGRRAFMTEEEVVAVARRGAELGCTEALFTLGDKPELRYEEARREVRCCDVSGFSRH